ncbi:hypothetical protein FA10DRAFT_283501 [Acaromyces ingoldii]|uniref:RING-type domain-containing protein n=1 Tax=Acaromyces ingoldii TaxID=215250 RepID=A0A316YXG0_9BASI|nr:hypothetical protein FA10DRAFT_283501 [Acaromyces ingoldii]PWN93881.1 hypothetical protein FA10DRAFT_283501 [Acaromyces ingoldii]
MGKRKASLSSACSSSPGARPTSPIEDEGRRSRLQRRRLVSEDDSLSSSTGPDATVTLQDEGHKKASTSSRSRMKGKATCCDETAHETADDDGDTTMQVDESEVPSPKPIGSSGNDGSVSRASQRLRDKGKAKDEFISNAPPASQASSRSSTSGDQSTTLADSRQHPHSSPSLPALSDDQQTTLPLTHPISRLADANRGGLRHPAITSALGRAAMGRAEQPGIIAGTNRHSRGGSEPYRTSMARGGQHESVHQEGPHSILSALLADILGLNGRPATAASGAPTGSAASPSGLMNPSTTTSGLTSGTPSTPPQGGAGPFESQRRPRNPNVGGTSVIVQGALITRTAHSQGQNAQRDSSEQRSQQHTNEFANEAQQQQQQRQQPPGTGTSWSPPPGTGPAAQGQGGEGVATIEEQADMLSRLLSVATAATASSLVSNALLAQPQRRPPSVSSSLSQQRQEGSSSSLHRTQSRSSVLSSNSAARWSNRISSIVERISGIGERIFGSRRGNGMEASTTSNVPSQQLHQGSTSTASDEEAPSENSRSINSVSYMLREAIREGIEGPRMRRANPSTRAPLPTRDITERASVDGSAAGSAVPQTDSTVNPDATERIRRVDAILDAVRQGSQERGEPGSFDRFIFDLAEDLNVAVRGLPSSSEPPRSVVAVAEGEQRRRQDIQGGQLSFYRSFTFPAAPPRALPRNDGETHAGAGGGPPSSDGNVTSSPPRPHSDPPLFPCIVVGVRSLDAAEPALNEQTARQPTASVNTSANTAAASTPDASNDTTQGATPGGTTARPEQIPSPRFLLFVSGGHYPSSHPVFHASSEEAGRDLMILMEFLGAMATFQHKPSTVTREQIEQSDLRVVKGDPIQILDLLKLGQVTENTSEKCLICLEDWKSTMTMPNQEDEKEVEVDEERRLLGCKHLFHSACIDQWLINSNNSCPICRRQAVFAPGAPRPSEHPVVPPTAAAAAAAGT